jgi:hypothetical protein
VARVAVRPGDIYAHPARYVNLDARWFFSRVERSRHGPGARSALGLAVAAIPGRNGIPVRAGLRVPEEGANALVQLRADDVFEFAGLRMRLGILNGKSVFEEPLGQAVTADHVACALAAHGRKLHFPVLHLDQVQIGHPRQNSRGGLFRNDRQLSHGPRRMQALRLCRLSFLAANPNLLEEMVEADFVVSGNGSATVRRVSERAIERVARTVLRRVEMQVAVGQLDAAVRLAGDVRVVRHQLARRQE